MMTLHSPLAPMDIAFSATQCEHARLLAQLRAEPGIVVEGSAAQQEWLSHTRRFFSSVGNLLQEPREHEVIEWVARTAAEWQRIMSADLALPIDVRKEIGMRETAVAVAEVVPSWDRTVVRRYLEQQSYSIGAHRKIMELLQQVQRLQLHPQRIHQEIPSSNKEYWQDWYHACLFLALDVILGRIDFAHSIDPSAFDFLETVWLNDIKRLQAFLLWEADGSAATHHSDAEYYYKACGQIDVRLGLVPPAPDGVSLTEEPIDETAFEPIHRWFKQRFQLNGSVAGRDEAMRTITSIKAERIWEATGRSDANKNWTAAELFTKQFYGHLIPAAVHGKPEDLCHVRRSLLSYSDYSEGCELVNGLEAAIVASFISPWWTRSAT